MIARRKGSYGIDAPYLLPIPLLLVAWNIVQGIKSKTPWPFWAAALVVACIECLFIPFGTILGVFTIVALSRECARALFSTGQSRA